MKTNLCGEIVAYSVNGVFVSRETVVNALKKHGLTTIVVPQAEPRTFLRRAIADCVTGGLIRPIGEDATQVGYAVLDEESNIETASYHASLRESIVMHKPTGTVTFTRKTALSDRIEKAVKVHGGSLVTREITYVIKKALVTECDGVAVRPQGGVYFVPTSCKSKLNALESAIAEAANNGRVRFFRLSVIQDARSVKDLADILLEFAKDESAVIVNEAVKAASDALSRPCQLKTRMSRVGALLNKITKYEEALGKISVEGTQQYLANAKRTIKKLMLAKALARKG